MYEAFLSPFRQVFIWALDSVLSFELSGIRINGDKWNLCLALSYSGRTEIVDAPRALARKVEEGPLKPEEIDEELFARHIYQPGADPDLIIRTAGEMRLSNFLLWEASYSEFYSTPLCWPEFDIEELHDAIHEYNRRVRKYGGLIQTRSEKGS